MEQIAVKYKVNTNKSYDKDFVKKREINCCKFLTTENIVNLCAHLKVKL